MRAFWTTTILAVSLLTTISLKALPVSTSLIIGKPLVFVDLARDRRDTLGALGALGTDINIFIPDYPFAAGVYYEAFVKSDYGILPMNNAGIQLSYYPFGKPVQVQNQSGEISIKNLGVSIYGTLGSGLTFMNIRDKEGTYVFGAAAFNLRVSSTFEYPLNEVISGGGTLIYQTTFGGSEPMGEEATVGFTGWSILGRLVFTIN